MGFNHSISGERTLFQAPLTALLDKLSLPAQTQS
jgi:hypothetical protein